MVARPTSPATRRSPLGAAAVAALTLILAGCSGSGGSDAALVATSDGAATTAVTAATAPTTVAPSTAAPTVAPGPPAPTTAPVDAPALLAGAVERLRAGYDVDTNVTAGDRSTNLAGRVVGVNSLFTLTSGSASLEYLQVPPQVWVREPGGDWNEANSESAPKESLGTIAAPAAVTFVSAAADGQRLKVSYPGAALGSESPTVDADLVLEPNGGLTMTYAVVTQGKTVTVVTRMAPAADVTPIGPPA